MSQDVQSYANHAKMVPLFHYVGSPILLVLLGWHLFRIVRDPSVETIMALALLFVVILAFFYARIFALTAQDRVIRLEERLRMERLFEGDLRARIGEFTTGQLVALRFASDEELPDLARKVLDEGIRDRKVIKQAVKHWRADHQRV